MGISAGDTAEYTLFGVVDTGNIAEYPVLWEPALAVLPNTQYFGNRYWWYCRIPSILAISTGGTAEYSVFWQYLVPVPTPSVSPNTQYLGSIYYQ